MARRVGLWLIGAYGGVGSTTALGLAALAKGLIDTTGMVTALPEFAKVDFDAPSTFVLGGHDLRASLFTTSVEELRRRSNVFSEYLIEECSDVLAEWSGNVRPGILLGTNQSVLDALREDWSRKVASPREAIDVIRSNLEGFRDKHKLDQIVVINVASTEPPVDPDAISFGAGSVSDGFAGWPSSSLYAWAAVEAGCSYVNLTPSLGGSFPAFEEHCKKHKVPHAGQDAKTGETLLKSVLAPMFAMRNLRVLSWVGHNILGNRDGQVLADPANKASKLKSKDALLAELLGYKPQSHVSIEYIESLDDWKTAWDHIHFSGFLGTKMTLQFTWQGCDSLLAAPLVIDLARLLLLAHRRGDTGVLPAAACFFKSPLGVNEHELGKQFIRLLTYLN
jgi:myo-inositol-1-phosphate synthase